jgi:hypothetical protein
MNIPSRNKGFALAITVIISLGSLLQSCVEYHIDPAVPVHGDYFPMTTGSWWEYAWKYPCWPDTATACYDTITYTAEPVTRWDDRQYYPLSIEQGTFLWIRKDGHAYYSFGAYLPEYKFLDASLPVNRSWVSGSDSGLAWEDFTITEVNAAKTIRGIAYRDVVVVRQRQFRKDENGTAEVARTVHHYYARGIGEIYTYCPAPPVGDQNQFEVFLTRFEIR